MDREKYSKKKHLYPALMSMKIEVPYLKKNVREFVRLMDPLIEEREDLKPAELMIIRSRGFDPRFGHCKRNLTAEAQRDSTEIAVSFSLRYLRVLCVSAVKWPKR